jgi:phosphatidylserine/phosphatidylglycerophosphate/cardiolipin synthase-like enzyme
MKFFATLILLGSLSGFAKTEVLFHPTDPTLEKIASWVQEAHHSIDIAMYNMETGLSSPVIAAFMSPEVQSKLVSGELQVRVLFQGYGTPEENAKKMADLEALGLDVRAVGPGRDVHHKFALIDSATQTPRVISGSANWSMNSYRNYDENILFFDDEDNITAQFQVEFERLWNHSVEFGRAYEHPALQVVAPVVDDQVVTFFNSPRFIERSRASENFLSRQIADAIDQAQSEILIASTRVRLKNILASLKAAADRGVQIKILLSQDDYSDLWKRADPLLTHPHIQTRIKFYNLKVSQYLTYQMHNKFILIDNSTMFTGSFNWSDSSETNYIENLMRFRGQAAQEILPAYTSRFEMIWERGRVQLPAFIEELTADRAQQILPSCGFAPISLTAEEVAQIRRLAPKCGKDQ